MNRETHNWLLRYGVKHFLIVYVYKGRLIMPHRRETPPKKLWLESRLLKNYLLYNSDETSISVVSTYYSVLRSTM